MISLIFIVVVMAGAGWLAWRRWSYWRTPTGPQPPAERSPQARAFEAFARGNRCLAAGQWADATAAFEQARAGSQTGLCGRAAGRSRPAAARGQRPGPRRGRRVTAWQHASGPRPRAGPRSPAGARRAALIPCVTSPEPSGQASPKTRGNVWP
jgi:hypothetical protein